MRVIAGLARGRALRAPVSERTRPTGDKVKGAIFSALEALAYKRGFEQDHDASGSPRFAAAQAWPRVLDLYAGSGALGIEALSRGAERADFVESEASARAVIQANLGCTGLRGRGRIHAGAAAKALSTLSGSYDLILADPPYADTGAVDVLAALGGSSLVNERSVLVWEHPANREPPQGLGRLQRVRTRRYGAAALSLYAAPDAETEDGAEAE